MTLLWIGAKKMNNRQKAKHFKRLYEQTLLNPFKPSPYICEPIALRHLKAIEHVPFNDDCWKGGDELAVDLIARSLIYQFKDELKKKIIVSKDDAHRIFDFELNVWVKE